MCVTTCSIIFQVNLTSCIASQIHSRLLDMDMINQVYTRT